jgi:prepilin signal peptidase PulO-like enzyme (type II secretory pathway)
MGTFGTLIAFIFGTIIGSFLNVVAARYNSGFSINGRSMCMSCGKKLGPAELVPVVSYAALRGRCSRCKSHISLQYPVIEFLAGLLFAGVYLVTGLSHSAAPEVLGYGILYSAAWSVLVVIVVYDIKHKIIPDLLVFLFIALSFLEIAMLYGTSLVSMPHLLDALLSGPLVAAPFLALWLVSGGRWIGLGDGKLALGIGWFLGLSGAISAILLGFWSGAFLSILLLLMNKLPERAWLKRVGIFPRSINAKTEVPFAPFLILGTALVFFFHVAVIAL